MATLTADQKEEVRADSGDFYEPYDVSDVALQAIYDDPARANGSLDRLKVYVLRRRWGKAKVEASRLADASAGVVLAQATQIKALLDYWERQTGMNVIGIITGGTIDLDLDEPCPEGMNCS